MSDGIGLAEVLLGLPGFRVLDVVEDDNEVVVRVETTVTRVFCETCGVRAEPQDRMRVDVRDLACFGRPTRMVWVKRRWLPGTAVPGADVDRAFRARRRTGRADPACRC